jgi:uncharacterized membrane protein YbhN (UPF0104 family)
MLDNIKKVRYRYIIKLLVTVGLAVYLLHSCDISLLISTLSNINVPLACVVFVSSLLLFFNGAINLWLLFNSICPMPLRLFMYSYSYGCAVNLFTPGQLGDVSLAILLKKYGIYYSQSTLAYTVDKIISLVCIIVVGYIGARFLLKGFAEPIWIFSIPIVCVILVILGLCFIVYIPYDKGQVGRVKQFIKNLYRESLLWKSKSKAIALNICLTILKWLILSITYYFAFDAFGINASWPEVGIIPIIATLIGYIPISIGGIGTVELCAVYLFSLISIDRVYVIDVYIFLRFIMYLQAGVVLGLCNWQFRKAQTL